MMNTLRILYSKIEEALASSPEEGIQYLRFNLILFLKYDIIYI